MNRKKQVAIGILLAVALGAGLYFGGRWQERGLAAGERVQLLDQVQAAQDDHARMQARLALAGDSIRLFQARALLFETATDLDQRNFGTANRHLDMAARHLEAVRTIGQDTDGQRLRELQRAIAGTDLTVATNLEAQRARVLEYTARLDELLTR